MPKKETYPVQSIDNFYFKIILTARDLKHIPKWSHFIFYLKTDFSSALNTE